MTAFSKCRSCVCSSFFSPSQPSSLCSILDLFFVLHSLLCGIDLPVSLPLHPGHPSVAPQSLMCALVFYILLTVGSGAATVERASHFSRSLLLARVHLLHVRYTLSRWHRLGCGLLQYLAFSTSSGAPSLIFRESPYSLCFYHSTRAF